MVTSLINICHIEAGIEFSTFEFHHLLILYMDITRVHIPVDAGIQLQTNGDYDPLTWLSHASGCYCDPSIQNTSPVYVNATSII